MRDTSRAVYGAAMVLGVLGSVGCSNHGPEGTVVKPGPGIAGLPGGPEGVSASHAVPISGGTLLVTNDNQAIAADPDRDRVFVVNLADQSVRDVALEAGDEPGRAVEDANGRVHVALRRGGAIVTIDPSSAKAIARRGVCPSPRGIAYDAASDSLHVACQSGELVTMPAAGGNPTRVLKMGWDLRDVIVRGEQLLVSRFKSAELMVVDGAGDVQRTLQPGPGKGLGANFEPAVAWRTLALPNGEVMMLHQRANPAEIAIGPAGYYSGSSCNGSIVEGAITQLDPDDQPGYYPTQPTLTLAMLIGPSDIAVSRDGQQMAVVTSGNSWGATRSGTPVLLPKLQLVPVDLNEPDPCGEKPEPEEITGEPIALAFDITGRVLVQSREPAQIQIVGGPTIRLSDDSRADTGLALFHKNSGFGISCASCHAEGNEDGRVWQFSGVGPRRTQSMSGGIMGTAPFHWAGDIEDFPTLIHEVFESRMGGTRPNKPQINAFSSWVNTVPAPVGAAVDAGAADRGRALFEDPTVGCSTCHSGKLLTNNTSYNVGTGGPFQVPSLLGVGARGPFLHDGCADTLLDRFTTCGGGDAHGNTSHLTATQLDDLVSYLETL